MFISIKSNERNENTFAKLSIFWPIWVSNGVQIFSFELKYKNGNISGLTKAQAWTSI